MLSPVVGSTYRVDIEDSCFLKKPNNLEPRRFHLSSTLPISEMAQERLFQLANQLLAPSQPKKVIPIDHGWLFKQQEGSDSARTFRPAAMFPTNIHLDLLAHKLIPDPLKGTNESEVQWVGDKTWVYRCSFAISFNEVDKLQYASLVFEGLDTFCTASLDGEVILHSDNMFILHRIDVRDLLKRKHEHVLELVFESATERGQLEMRKHLDHAWGTWNGDPSRSAVRKAQYHYVRVLLLIYLLG